MTSCDTYQAGIVALFDNEAKDEDLRLAAGHLQDCPDCRAFCLDLIGIRRALATASVPSLPLAARQAVLDAIKADEPDREKRAKRVWSIQRLGRWAAVLVIGSLLIACFVLGRTAQDLRFKLVAAERQVVTMQEQAELAKSQERQQMAISALYFRMAELEERVNRSPSSQRTSLPSQGYDRAEKQSNL